jgi:LacI family transcriptional regulator
VPDDLAIAGFDNIEFAEYAAVPLTSVNYAVEAVTDQAVERLMQLIGVEGELPEPVITQIEPELMIRQSTRRLPH